MSAIAEFIKLDFIELSCLKMGMYRMSRLLEYLSHWQDWLTGGVWDKKCDVNASSNKYKGIDN